MRKAIGAILISIGYRLMGYGKQDPVKTLENKCLLLQGQINELLQSKISLTKEVKKILPLAKEICLAQEGKHSSSGWKRTGAMTELIRKGVRMRDANLAIELAIREIK